MQSVHMPQQLLSFQTVPKDYDFSPELMATAFYKSKLCA